MNKRWFGLIIALFLMGRFAGAAFGLEPFKIDQYVTDRAGILTESQRYQLSNALYQYAQKNRESNLGGYRSQFGRGRIDGLHRKIIRVE